MSKKLMSEVALNGDGTANWNMETIGRDGQLYTGLFKFRCELTPIQMLAVDRDQRRLLGEHAAMASDFAFNMASALAQLKHSVQESPPFWNDGTGEFPGGNIKDLSIVTLVQDAATAAVEKYALHLQAESAKKAERIRKHLKDMATVAKKAKAKEDAEEEGTEE